MIIHFKSVITANIGYIFKRSKIILFPFVAMSDRKRKNTTSIDHPITNSKQQKIYNYFVDGKNKENSSFTEIDNASNCTDPFDVTFYLVDNTWKIELNHEFKKEYFQKIRNFLAAAYQQNKQIFPPRELIFNAFNLVSLPNVKVVIIGQDPYHGIGQAHGLCFSVPDNVAKPPSLQNIFKELQTDIPGFEIPSQGNLIKWAHQGVLLLNATLTVEANMANSHQGIGWQTFTDACIRLVNRDCVGVVFILWGGFAQKKEKLIDDKKHAIVKAAHPSPLSATKFFGNKCFSKTNELLKSFGKEPIDWILH